MEHPSFLLMFLVQGNNKITRPTLRYFDYCSFGKQPLSTDGKRGTDCLVLEYSEMIVVSTARMCVFLTQTCCQKVFFLGGGGVFLDILLKCFLGYLE